MQIYFNKIHGTGNDFVVIDDFSNELELTAEQVALICDRHFGIGADGLILVRPPARPGSIAYMHYINADGTLAEMCGNGIRCMAKYLVDKGFVTSGADGFTVDTLAGPRPIRYETDGCAKMTRATVDMGSPLFEPVAIPTTLAPTSAVAIVTNGHEVDQPAVVDSPLQTAIGEMTFTCVNMGNPHAVTFMGSEFAADPLGFDINTVGPQMESHPVFPQKANIEFATVVQEPNGVRIVMRVWERGVGETLACGTGACATAVAAAITGRAGRKATLQLLGGNLEIEWQENNHVMMTGPAVTVFEGSIEL